MKTTTKELNKILRDALFDELNKQGVETVTVEYDGSGDQGAIESIESNCGNLDKEKSLGVFSILQSYRYMDGGRIPVYSEQAQTVEEAIETVAYSVLENKHEGWEIEHGAFGTFTFDVGGHRISLSHKERYEECNVTEGEV